jgi:type VI protein secretion system component VasK
MRVQRAFFPVGGDSASVQVQLQWEPVAAVSGIQFYQGSLKVGEREVRYLGANDNGTLPWPAAGGDGTAILRLLARRPTGANKWADVTVIPQSKAGVWGFFRLLDIAARSQTANGVDATWTLYAEGMPVRATAHFSSTAPENPFASELLRNLMPPLTATGASAQ